MNLWHMKHRSNPEQGQISLGLLTLWLTILTIVPFGTSKAQSGSKHFSLKEAVDYATANQNSIKIAKLDEYLAEKRVKEYSAVALPQANGYFRFTDNLVIPTMVVPANQFDPTAPEDVFFKLQFGVQYQAQGGAQLSQLIFSGSYIYGLRAAKEYLAMGSRNVERTKVETAETVSKAYYAALIASKQFQILQSNVDRVQKLLTTMEAMHAEGFIEKLDLDRIGITYRNLLTEQTKVARLVALSADVLKFQMGLDINTPVILTDTIASPTAPPPVQNPDEGSGFHRNRTEYELLRMTESIHLLNSKRIKAGSLPAVSAFGDLGYTWAAPNLGRLDEEGFWFPFAVVGLQVGVPLFNGFAGKARLQQSNLEAEKIRLTMNTFEDAVRLEVSNARVTIANAYNTILSNQATLNLARDVSRITRIKYEEGIGSNLEVIEAENTLREAESNYLSSLYEYKLAEIALKKAKGQLLN